MSWPLRPLVDVANFCLGKMLDQKKNRGELKPYLANVNVRWGEFDFDNLREMRFEAHEEERYGLKPGDIVMCEGGEPGRCALWSDQVPGMMIQKAIHRIRPHAGIDSRFLYYSFLKKKANNELSGYFTGSTIKHLPREKLALIKVEVPPLPVQQRIAATLGNYDDLIENNRRRMALLEESARLLYREWFVHFRFPGHEHVKIVDGVPEGWETVPVQDVCETYDDGDWLETKDQGGDDYRILQISNIGLNSFVETGNQRFITAETFRRLNCHEVLPGDILVSRMPRPIGRGWLVTEMPFKMVTAVDVTIVRADSTKVCPFYLLHHINSEHNIRRCEGGATGSTRPRVSRRLMGSLPIVLPPLRLQERFSEIAQQNNEQKRNLEQQNEKLAQARDLLLPRLMRGEIAV